MTFRLREHGVEAILLDIEGTTTPIAFVHLVLFQFARLHLRAYLLEHASEAAPALSELRAEWQRDREASGDAVPAWIEESSAGAAAYVEWLMDRDRKSSGLKRLQGEIWNMGYRDGRLKGEVFEDVPAAMTRWRQAGIPMAIYSSGSVLAQKLLFSTTAHGDLAAFVSAFFDTAVGPKTAADSYRRIASSLKLAASGMLFVSDAVAELDAASNAGCQVLLAVRPGNHELGSHAAIAAIRSFDEIEP